MSGFDDLPGFGAPPPFASSGRSMPGFDSGFDSMPGFGAP
jgi:hypothetical protein